jgi:hypothetical protein
MSENLERDWYSKVYDILVEDGGADERMRESFIEAHLDIAFPCTEWRFAGKLLFGGKYRNLRNKVDYYPEHASNKRNKLVELLNQKLADINLPCPARVREYRKYFPEG